MPALTIPMNVIFPAAIYYWTPLILLISLPVNFLIDSFVILVASKVMGADVKKTYKSSIVRVFTIGYLADFAGTLIVFAATTIGPSAFAQVSTTRGSSVIYGLIGTLVAALIIYFMNRKFSLTKTDLSSSQRRTMALSLAVLTAPYFFAAGPLLH